MSKIGDGSKIWVLGRKVDGVDKSMLWNQKEIANFSDCDVLVVDPSTLNKRTIFFLGIDNVSTLFDQIKKRFQTGLTIICVSSPTINGAIAKDPLLGGFGAYRLALTRHAGTESPLRDEALAYYPVDNYFWSPAGFVVKQIPRGSALEKQCTDDFPFNEYVDSVKSWRLAMEETPFAKKQHDSKDGDDCDIVNLITSKSGDYLGGEFQFYEPKGTFIILPPLNPPDKSIQRILKTLGVKKETQPTWAEDITIPGVDKLCGELFAVEKTLETKLANISSRIDEKKSLRKLVYATDKTLEKTCKKALKMIGLSNVRSGKPGREDLIFDFSKNPDYQICAVEVKGLEKNLRERDIRQLSEWMYGYIPEGTKTKGVILANTFRLEDMSTSKPKRSQLGKSNLEVVKKRKFCIFPTHVLLDLCRWVLDGNKPDLQKIENAIANTDGVIKLDDLKHPP